MKFVIPGPPITKMAPKGFVVPRKGVNGRPYNQIIMYNPQKELFDEVKGLLTLQLQKALNSENKEIQLDAANLSRERFFTVILGLYLPISESLPKSTQCLISWGLPYPSKKDTDNCAKFYLDCIKKTLIADDHMVIDERAFKCHSPNPRTEIFIMPVKVDLNPMQEKILSTFSIKDFDDLKLFAIEILNLEETQIVEISHAIKELAIHHADKLMKIKKEILKQCKKEEVTSEKAGN
jgi:Holliday junction resolvase RusA-like endonuclease